MEEQFFSDPRKRVGILILFAMVTCRTRNRLIRQKSERSDRTSFVRSKCKFGFEKEN